MESIIDVLRRPGAHGKVSAIICFEDSQLDLVLLSDKIRTMYSPDAAAFSVFDTKELRMIESTTDAANDYKRLIGQQILNKGKESIIIEHYNDLFSIAHNFLPEAVEAENGRLIIDWYLHSIQDLTFLVGFELGIDLRDFASSVVENIQDEALHPIVMYKKTNGLLLERKFEKQPSNIHPFKGEIIGRYIQLFDLAKP